MKLLILDRRLYSNYDDKIYIVYGFQMGGIYYCKFEKMVKYLLDVKYEIYVLARIPLKCFLLSFYMGFLITVKIIDNHRYNQPLNIIKKCYCIINYVCVHHFFSSSNPCFYSESQSLYAEVSVLLSKCPAFYAKLPVWVSTRNFCSVCLYP